MRKKCTLFIVIMLFSLALGGCWDVKYLDQLSIVIAMGVDVGKDQDIQVSIQIVNPSEVSMGSGKGGGGGGGKSIVTTYSESGKTIAEAIRKLSNLTARRLYFSHNQVLVVGEALAQRGISPLFDFFERNQRIRTDFYIVVARDAMASDVLKITTPNEKIPGNSIHHLIDHAEKYLGTSYAVRTKDLIEHISTDKKETALGGIEIIGDAKKGGSASNIGEIDPQTTLQLTGMAVFKNDKLVDYFKPKTSRGIVWIRGKINNTIINVPCNKTGQIAIELLNSSTSMKAEFPNGKPAIHISIKQEGNIAENLCPDMAIEDKETFNQLEQGTQEQVKNEILAAVKQAQKLDIDIFGFGEAIYRVNPAYWKKNKENWSAIFAKVPVQIEVDTKIRKEGVRNRSYYKKNQ